MTTNSFGNFSRIGAILLTLSASSGASAAPNSSWKWLGPAPIPNGQTTNRLDPVSGRVTAIAIHPTNPQIAYVGTAQGGVYRTRDGGSSWTQLFDSAATLAIGSLTLAPSDPTTLFIGTGEADSTVIGSDNYYGAGLYVITNADTSAVLSGPFGSDTFAGNSISRIVVSAADANTILASVSQGSAGIGGQLRKFIATRGIYRCTNALSSSPAFTPVTVLTSAFPGDTVFDMAADPTDLNNLVCAIPQGIYRSSNALSATPTFTQMFAGAPPFSLVRFALNKTGATLTLLAGTSESQGGFTDNKGNPITKQGTLRRATFDGTNWSAWSAPIVAANGFADPQAFYDIGIAIDPTNSNKIYIGGTSSTYGGPSVSFSYSTDAGGSFINSETGLHSDVHAIAVAPSNPSVIYFGSDGGIWKSTDAGANWTSLNNGTFSATQFESIAIHPTDRNFLLGGTQDNGTEYLDPNGAWSQAALGDGGYCLIDQNATDTTNVTEYHTYYNQRNTRIGFDRRDTTIGTWVFHGYRQDVNGNQIVANPPNNGIGGSDNVLFYAPMALGPGNPNTVYFGTDRLYRSSDKGANMSVVSQAPLDPTSTDATVGYEVSSLSISPQNDNVRLVGLTSGKVFTTTTGSVTMTNVTGTIPAEYIGRVLIDPKNVQTAYVAIARAGLAAGQNLWKTINLGETGTTWSASANGLPPIAVNALVIDPADSTKIYAGTDDGVYVSSDSGANWTAFNNGLPHVAVFDLAFQQQNRVLRAATHGRGIYEILPDPVHVPPDVTVTAPANQSTINAFATIAGTAIDNSGSGIAGNSVNFTLFHVSTGQYWSGTDWVNTQVQLSASINSGTNVWTWNGKLPNSPDGSLRTGEYALSASTHDNVGDNSVPQSGVNNITFIVDVNPPSVSISSPADQSIITAQNYSFSGTASDDFAVDRVILFIRRNSDSAYWNGSGWIADPLQANLSSIYTSSNQSWVSNSNLPVPGGSLANGSYNFIALAKDKAGNSKQSDSVVTVDFHVQDTWTGNGNNNQWSNSANWSSGVPTSDAIVTINSGSIDNTSLGSVAVYGLNLNGGTLTTSEMFITKFNLLSGVLAGGTVNINGSGGTMNWTGGQFNGTLGILNGASLNISGATGKLIGSSSVVNNSGVTTWTGPASLKGFQNTTFNNLAGAKFLIASDGTVFANFYGGNVFNNVGTMEKTAGNGVSQMDSWTYATSGIVKASTGVLDFNATLALQDQSTITGLTRVRFSGGAVALTGGTKIDGATLELANSTLTGTASATFSCANGGALEWTGGVIGGTVNFDATASLKILSSNTKQIATAGILNNAGGVLWNGSGAIQGNQNSSINNLAGATFAAVSDAAFINFYQGNAFNNAAGALFIKVGGSGGSTRFDWDFSNAGTLQAGIGTIELDAAGTSSGLFTADAGMLIRFAGGAATVTNGALFAGAGKTQIVGGTLTATGNVSSGTPANPLATFEVGGGTLTGSPTGVFTAYGTVNWTSGAIGGLFRIANSATLNLSSDSLKQILTSGVIQNAGIVNFSGNGQLQGIQNVTVNNLAGGIWNLLNDGTFVSDVYGGNVFNNAGTFSKTGGAGISLLNVWTFNNTGTLNIATGELEFDDTLNLNSGTAFAGAGVIRLAGTVTAAADVSLSDQVELAGGTFNSANSVNPPKLVSGNLTWTAGTITGTWNIASGATLTVSGNATKQLATSAILNNSGTIAWSGTGPIQGVQYVTINNLSGGNVNAASDAAFSSFYGGNVFNNASGATFTKTGTSGGNTHFDWDLNNAGNLVIAAGSVELAGSGVSTGLFTANAGSLLRFVGGSPSLGNGAVLAGAGRHQLVGGAVTITGSAKAGGPGSPTTVDLMGGNLGSTGSALTAYGTFNWTGGTLTSVLLPAGSTMKVSGADAKQITTGGTIENNGTITWSGGSAIQGIQNVTIVNGSGAAFIMAADGTPLANFYGGNNFLNQGSFIKSGGAGITAIDVWAFYNGNGASIEAHTGTIAFSNELHLNGGGSLLGFGPAATFISSNGSTSLIGTTLLNGVSFILAGNTLTGDTTAGLDAINGGQFEWTGGTIAGTLALSNRCVTSVFGPVGKELGPGAVLNNSGALALLGGNAVRGNQNSTLSNLTGAILTIQNGATLTAYMGGNVLKNAGTLNLGDAVAGFSFGGWGFTQTSTGIVNLRIASTSGFDALQFGEAANLGGTINVSLITNFLPNVGDSFPLITYSSATGNFSAVHAPGFNFNASYNPSGFNLVAASQPTLAEWKQGYFNDPNSPQAADTAAPAGDGIPNLLKYALGLNPTLPYSPGAIPLVGIGTNGSATAGVATTAAVNITQHPTFSFRRIDPANVTYVVQASADLKAWEEIARLNTGTNAWLGTASVAESGSGSTRAVVVTDANTLQNITSRFYRLTVTH